MEKTIKKFIGGLASGMTYIGADKMEKIIGKADFVYLTSAGRGRSGAHANLR